MAEKITCEIDVDKNRKDLAEAKYVDKERMIPVEGVFLKICLPKDEFDNLIKLDM